MFTTLAQLPIEELRTQIGNGVVLMILGMAIVFIFLTILVFTTKAVSKIVKKYEKEAPKKAVAPQMPAGTAVCTSEAEVAAAIVAAVAKSRN